MLDLVGLSRRVVRAPGPAILEARLVHHVGLLGSRARVHLHREYQLGAGMRTHRDARPLHVGLAVLRARAVLALGAHETRARRDVVAHADVAGGSIAVVCENDLVGNLLPVLDLCVGLGAHGLLLRMQFSLGVGNRNVGVLDIVVNRVAPLGGDLVDLAGRARAGGARFPARVILDRHGGIRRHLHLKGHHLRRARLDVRQHPLGISAPLGDGHAAIAGAVCHNLGAFRRVVAQVHVFHRLGALVVGRQLVGDDVAGLHRLVWQVVADGSFLQPRLSGDAHIVDNLVGVCLRRVVVAVARNVFDLGAGSRRVLHLHLEGEGRGRALLNRQVAPLNAAGRLVVRAVVVGAHECRARRKRIVHICRARRRIAVVGHVDGIGDDVVVIDAFLVLGVHRALIGGHVRHQRFHGVLDLVGDTFGLVAGAGIPVNLESGIVFHLARGQRRVGHCRGEAQGLRFASGQRDAGPLQAVLRRVVLEAARTLGAAVLIGQPRPNRIGHAGVARGRLALVFHDQRVHNFLSDLDLRRRIGICALHHVQARRRGVGARLVHGRGARLARLGQPAAGFARIVGRILEEHGVVDEGAVLHGLVVGHRHGELHLLGVVFAHLEVLQHPLDIAVCRDVNAAVFHALEFSVDGYVVAHPHEVCLGLAGVHGAQGVLDGAVGRDLAIGGRVGRLVDGHLGLVGRRRRPVHRVRHRAGCLRGVDVSVRPVVLPVRRVGDDRIVGHIAVHRHVKAHGHAAAVFGDRQVAPLDARLAGGRHGAPVAFARNAADHERRILGNLVAYAHCGRRRIAFVCQRDVVGDLVAALHVRTRRRVCGLGRRQLHRLVQRMLDGVGVG